MAAPPPSDSVANLRGFFHSHGIHQSIPASADGGDFFSDMIRSLLSVDLVEPGRVVCSLSASPYVLNSYDTLHGGAVASVAEKVAVACGKTVAGDKELFLGELSTSYLSAARVDDKVEVEGRVLRRGRRVIVTSIDLRIKESKKLLYTSRATLYIMPSASL
ncbi:hypothetical protein LUZ60_016426 [Juncus effusus]|nr:hypothetical protein LUZ60_016426 [Juncus effusus]